VQLCTLETNRVPCSHISRLPHSSMDNNGPSGQKHSFSLRDPVTIDKYLYGVPPSHFLEFDALITFVAGIIIETTMASISGVPIQETSLSSRRLLCYKPSLKSTGAPLMGSRFGGVDNHPELGKWLRRPSWTGLVTLKRVEQAFVRESALHKNSASRVNQLSEWLFVTATCSGGRRGWIHGRPVQRLLVLRTKHPISFSTLFD